MVYLTAKSTTGVYTTDASDDGHGGGNASSLFCWPVVGLYLIGPLPASDPVQLSWYFTFLFISASASSISFPLLEISKMVSNAAFVC